MRFALSPNDARIGDLVLLLDDDQEPYAEICRRVGAAAERLGCARPSYSLVRRLVMLRRRAAELERQGTAVLGEAAAMAAAGRVTSLVEAYVRAGELGGQARLVLQQHKAFGGRERGRGRAEEGDGAVRGSGATGPARRSRAP